MFNLKDETQTDQVHIIVDNHHTRIANTGNVIWGIDFEASGQRKGTTDNQKKVANKNQFRVRIYNVC